jgi:ribosomal protein S6--L-glutamate ligase
VKKLPIGVICTPKLNSTEKNLFPVLKERFDLILFPIEKDIDYAYLKKQSENIKLILNTAGDMPNTYDALEIVKTFENLGKRVIDSSKSFYYREDKWMFYQVCLKNKLPTPITYYIPRNITISKEKLRKILEEGPVVFKGAFSDTGRAVKRALNFEEALKVIKELRKKINIMPIVAQKYIYHGKISYRVTLAGNKIIQSIIKYGKTWKEGKLFWKNEKYRLFKVDKDLKKLCEKTAKVFGLEWCGIDLIRDEKGNWFIIEVNSCPSMDFVLKDMKRSNKELTKYLHKVCHSFIKD